MRWKRPWPWKELRITIFVILVACHLWWSAQRVRIPKDPADRHADFSTFREPSHLPVLFLCPRNALLLLAVPLNSVLAVGAVWWAAKGVLRLVPGPVTSRRLPGDGRRRWPR